MQVSLFEAAPELGGLARSFQLGAITIERYYHFICGGDDGYFRMLDDLGIPDRLCWNHTRMGFFYEGRLYPFSSAFDLLRFDGISLVGRLRYGLGMAYIAQLRRWRRLDEKRAEPWLRKLLGREVYEATWDPLLSIKFPQRHQELSAAWVWHRVHRVAKSRKSLLHRERLGYLEGGTQTLIDRLEQRLLKTGVELHRKTAVREILVDGNRVTGVRTEAGVEHFDALVAAVPLPVFLRIAPELHPEYFAELSGIDFIGVVCVVLRLRRPVTENFWTNVHDPRIPFNGCIEYTNLNPNMTPDDSAIVYVPYYLPRNGERFRYGDERLLVECLDSLRLINPRLTADDVIDYAVSRDPFAQVVCPVGFGRQVPAHETPIDGLYLVESSQLFPSDRTISGTLDLASAAAELAMAQGEGRQDRSALAAL